MSQSVQGDFTAQINILLKWILKIKRKKAPLFFYVYANEMLIFLNDLFYLRHEEAPKLSAFGLRVWKVIWQKNVGVSNQCNKPWMVSPAFGCFLELLRWGDGGSRNDAPSAEQPICKHRAGVIGAQVAALKSPWVCTVTVQADCELQGAPPAPVFII